VHIAKSAILIAPHRKVRTPGLTHSTTIWHVNSKHLQIDYARWFVWLFALATPGFAGLLLLASWSIVAEANGPIWSTGLVLAVFWVVFLGLLIVPGSWYLIQIWRGVPALQIDDRGLLWGNDWDRHVGIEWHEIARIGSRRHETAEYSDRLLLVEPKDSTIPSRFSRARRVMAWTSREIYGTPYVIGLRALRISDDQLIGAIRARFDGEIDLTRIS
jgi:hypothetical protein